MFCNINSTKKLSAADVGEISGWILHRFYKSFVAPKENATYKRKKRHLFTIQKLHTMQCLIICTKITFKMTKIALFMASKDIMFLCIGYGILKFKLKVQFQLMNWLWYIKII